MSANDTLRHLHDAGLHLELIGGQIVVTPRERLTEGLRQSIRDHRAELARMLSVAGTVVNRRLVKAINHCCEARGDGELNRASLVAESADLPQAEQIDLAEHFAEQAALWLRISGRSANH